MYIWKCHQGVDLYLEVSSRGRSIFGSVIKGKSYIWKCHQGVELYMEVSSRVSSILGSVIKG